MRIVATDRDPSQWRGDALVLFIIEGKMDPVDQLGEEIASLVKQKASRLRFTGKEDSLLAVDTPGGIVGSIYLAGLGSADGASPEPWRRGIALVVRQAGKDRHRRMLILPGGAATLEVHSALAEGALLSEYSFDRYKSGLDPSEKPEPIEELLVHGGDERSLARGSMNAIAQNFARDLVNEPGNVINPAGLAERASAMAGECGLECSIFDEEKMREMGMNGILSVGAGSHNAPRLIHLVYRPSGPSRERIAFVGKGLTFDSGGLNIKPGDYMRSMKGDKTGACNVLALMKAVAESKPDLEIHGFAGAAENMPGGGAYRPDDIIRMFNGKTVEVDNTDAEGRIVLGDVLAYASSQKPAVMIDMATLTGACVVALGPYTAGILGNDTALVASFREASGRTGERVWELPMDDERLKKKIRSEVADVANNGGRYGGAITAAMFLREFVGEGIKWLHVDIAGVDSSDEEYGYYRKGATGFGVRTCLEWLSKYYKQ